MPFKLMALSMLGMVYLVLFTTVFPIKTKKVRALKALTFLYYPVALPFGITKQAFCS